MNCPHNEPNKLSHGAGHGRGTHFEYIYCHECDEFIKWSSWGMRETQQKEVQNFVRWTIEQERCDDRAMERETL